MQSLQFVRNINEVFASANESGLLINYGWTVTIPRANAIVYVKSYGASSQVGFYNDLGTVCLTHGSAKMTFSEQEGTAIVDLIKAAYPESFP